MSYGGLRGAVAFALVLLIDPKIVPLQPMFMTTTIAVIYFTVFIQGISIKPLVKILNVKTAEKRKPTMNERIHERVRDENLLNSFMLHFDYSLWTILWLVSRTLLDNMAIITLEISKFQHFITFRFESYVVSVLYVLLDIFSVIFKYKRQLINLCLNVYEGAVYF